MSIPSFIFHNPIQWDLKFPNSLTCQALVNSSKITCKRNKHIQSGRIKGTRPFRAVVCLLSFAVATMDITSQGQSPDTRAAGAIEPWGGAPAAGRPAACPARSRTGTNEEACGRGQAASASGQCLPGPAFSSPAFRSRVRRSRPWPRS